ncbi:MAG: hypothetical protein ACLQBA_26365 [Candidatus Binataceae bacterium]|jgi:hypothetical protein
MKNVLLSAFAIIGVCAVSYFCWQRYQHHLEEQREQAIMVAPPAVPGMPDFRQPSTSPPPPQ